MRCPKCKKKIGRVIMTSECIQSAWLDGNKMVSYEDVEIGKTIKVECPLCQANITKYVKE